MEPLREPDDHFLVSHAHVHGIVLETQVASITSLADDSLNTHTGAMTYIGIDLDGVEASESSRRMAVVRAHVARHRWGGSKSSVREANTGDDSFSLVTFALRRPFCGPFG